MAVEPRWAVGEGSPNEADGFLCASGFLAQVPLLLCRPGGFPCCEESLLIKSSANRGLMVNRLFMEGYKQPVGLFNTFR